MALSLSYSTVNDNVVGNKRHRVVSVTFDSSYAVGGEAFTPAMVGFQAIDRVIFNSPLSNTAGTIGFVPRYNRASNTLQALKSNGTTNLIEATAVDLSAQVVEVTVVGY